MADFAEHFYARQVDNFTYTYCWVQIDLADENVVSIDYSENCSGEELYDAIEAHGFDTDRVFNHFEDYPYSGILLIDEY